MRRQIRLRYFEYTPKHRDEYDSRCIQGGRLSALLDVSDVPPRRARRFIVTLGRRLNVREAFVTTMCHYKPERLVWLMVSPGSMQGDFSPADFRALKVYLGDLQESCASWGARVLRCSKGLTESLPIADYGNTAVFYSLGLIEVLAKRKRTYDDELYLAIADGQAERRIRAAYRKNPDGTIAHISLVAKNCEYRRTLEKTVTECVQPEQSRPDRWERRALLAMTEKVNFARHLRAARRMDEPRTLEFVAGLHSSLQSRAKRALGKTASDRRRAST